MRNVNILINRTKAHEIVSLDIFDTIISRDCFSPKGIFIISEWLANKNDLRVPTNYVEKRILAEKLARNNAEKDEIQFNDILKYLILECSACDSIDIKKILDIELSLEIQYAYAIEAAKDLIAELNMEKLILTSDMYLDYDVIRAIISKNFNNLFKTPIYLSSNLGVTKKEGTMYDFLLRKYQISPEKILHIGDNKTSDFVKSREKGISSWHITSTSPTNYENKLYDNLVEKFSNYEGALFSEMFVGSIKKARLLSKTSDLEDVRFKLGLEAVSPILFLYVKWVLRQAKLAKAKVVYFIARDGQILLDMASYINERLGLDLELRYLYGSRQAWNLPSIINQITETDLSWILQSLPSINIKIISERLNLNTDILKNAYLSETGHEIDIEKYLESEDVKIIRQLILSPEITKQIATEAKFARNQMLEYLKKERVFDNSELHIVDLGWRGRLQDALEKVLGQEKKIKVYGYYFGLFDYQNSINGVKQAFLFNDKLSTAFVLRGRSFINFMEIFCAADHGTTLSYLNSKPVLKNEVNHEAINWGLETFRLGIFKYLKSLNDILLDLDFLSIDYSRNAVGLIIDRLRLNPSLEEARLIGSFPFSGDQRESFLKEFAPALTLEEGISYLLNDSYSNRASKTLWIQGSILRSDLIVRSLFNQYADLFLLRKNVNGEHDLNTAKIHMILKYSNQLGGMEKIFHNNTVKISDLSNYGDVLNYPSYDKIDLLVGSYSSALAMSHKNSMKYPSLNQINALYRMGSYEEALRYYTLRSKDIPLEFYKFNIEMCRKKINAKIN